MARTMPEQRIWDMCYRSLLRDLNLGCLDEATLSNVEREREQTFESSQKEDLSVSF